MPLGRSSPTPSTGLYCRTIRHRCGATRLRSKRTAFWPASRLLSKSLLARSWSKPRVSLACHSGGWTAGSRIRHSCQCGRGVQSLEDRRGRSRRHPRYRQTDRGPGTHSNPRSHHLQRGLCHNHSPPMSRRAARRQGSKTGGLGGWAPVPAHGTGVCLVRPILPQREACYAKVEAHRGWTDRATQPACPDCRWLCRVLRWPGLHTAPARGRHRPTSTGTPATRQPRAGA